MTDDGMWVLMFYELKKILIYVACLGYLWVGVTPRNS